MMNELLTHYAAEAESLQHELPWVMQLQQQARAQFLEKGLPSRYDEDWKYTRVETFLEKKFATASKEEHSLLFAKPHAPFEQRLVIYNGQLIGLDFVEAQFPQGVVVLPLKDAFILHEDLLKPLLSSSFKSDNAFQALNTACFHSGLFIYVPKGVKWTEPLLITHYQDSGNQAVYLRHVVLLEDDAEMTLIEEYAGDENSAYFTQTLTDTVLKPNSFLTHVKLQREGNHALHIGQLRVNQEKSSQLISHSLSLGGQMVRSDSHIYLKDERAQCLLNGIYLPGQGQHVDHHTLISHEVPHCESIQDYKGVLNGNAHGVFSGTVYVAKDAQKSIAHQHNKNLLLNKNAEIDTKPQLEIYADDVQCSHGATVGQLDEEALFYLATRGIGYEQASQFLIQGFTQDNLTYVSHPQLADWMRELINQKIG